MAFYFENGYRVIVRQFFNFFQGDKIKFVGKNFHLFVSTYLLFAFGIFCVLFTMLLSAHTDKGRLIYLVLAITLFFITTFATTYIDSTGYVAECTACQDGVKNLHYNAVNYDFHFITSLLVALSPLLLAFLKSKFQKDDSKSLPPPTSL